MDDELLNENTVAEHMVKLILKRGYSGISMLEISQLCGVQENNLYKIFKNKESILIYILKRMLDELHNHIFSIAEKQELPPPERLVRINNLLKDYFLDQKGCLIAAMGMENEMISDDAKKIMNQIFYDWKKTYAYLYKSTHSPYMADVLATNAIIFIEGAIVWLRVTGEDAPLKRVFNEINEKLPVDVAP